MWSLRFTTMPLDLIIQPQKVYFHSLSIGYELDCTAVIYCQVVCFLCWRPTGTSKYACSFAESSTMAESALWKCCFDATYQPLLGVARPRSTPPTRYVFAGVETEIPQHLNSHLQAPGSIPLKRSCKAQPALYSSYALLHTGKEVVRLLICRWLLTAKSPIELQQHGQSIETSKRLCWTLHVASQAGTTPQPNQIQYLGELDCLVRWISATSCGLACKATSVK